VLFLSNFLLNFFFELDFEVGFDFGFEFVFDFSGAPPFAPLVHAMGGGLDVAPSTPNLLGASPLNWRL
jgi:hypothetical protein